MNGQSRTRDGLGQPSAADYMSAFDKARARAGMQQAMDLGNATLRAVAKLRAALHGFTRGSGNGTAPKRILAKTGVTYFD